MKLHWDKIGGAESWTLDEALSEATLRASQDERHRLFSLETLATECVLVQRLRALTPVAEAKATVRICM